MINVAILGYGTVGKGTVILLKKNRELIREKTGLDISVKYIVDLRDFPGDENESKLVKDFNIVLSDPEVSIVCEMIGGSHPAYDFSIRALNAGKNVVTSNKEVVSNFGVELLETASKNGVSYLFEASVGGGIPILEPLRNCLAANHIERIDAIVNGTTNYILTRMLESGVSFEAALFEAKSKGYAEADPSADVDGIDAARKIVILEALANGSLFSPQTVHVEGIRGVTEEDVAFASSLGCCVKLIAHTSIDPGGKRRIFVAPCFVRDENLLSRVSGVFNAVSVYGDYVGNTVFYGRGAGAEATASAVCGDVIDAAKGASPISVWKKADNSEMIPYDEIPSAFCLIEDGHASLAQEAVLSELRRRHPRGRFYRVISE